MKLHILLFIFVLPMIGCSQRTTDISKVKSINYTASTRGFYLNIEINEENILIERSRESDTSISKSLSDEKWQHLITLISKFDVRKLDKMTSTSNRSEVDAAAKANLEVETENHLYSCSFDHGSPPEALKELMEYMLTLSESIE